MLTPILILHDTLQNFHHLLTFCCQSPGYILLSVSRIHFEYSLQDKFCVESSGYILCTVSRIHFVYTLQDTHNEVIEYSFLEHSRLVILSFSCINKSHMEYLMSTQALIREFYFWQFNTNTTQFFHLALVSKPIMTPN